jgi:hypothetical protein
VRPREERDAKRDQTKKSKKNIARKSSLDEEREREREREI